MLSAVISAGLSYPAVLLAAPDVCQHSFKYASINTKALRSGVGTQGLGFNLGDVLLSHAVSSAVPSGLRGLTSVFGMGTGVTPSLKSPRDRKSVV